MRQVLYFLYRVSCQVINYIPNGLNYQKFIFRENLLISMTRTKIYKLCPVQNIYSCNLRSCFKSYQRINTGLTSTYTNIQRQGIPGINT